MLTHPSTTQQNLQQLDTEGTTNKTTENKLKEIENNLDNFKQTQTMWRVAKTKSILKVSNNDQQPKTIWTTTTRNNSENILKQPKTTFKSLQQPKTLKKQQKKAKTTLRT